MAAGDLRTIQLLDSGPDESAELASCSGSALSTSTTYYYEVTAITPLGESNPSIEQSIRRPAALRWPISPGVELSSNRLQSLSKHQFQAAKYS